jgi:hypothetical protein
VVERKGNGLGAKSLISLKRTRNLLASDHQSPEESLLVRRTQRRKMRLHKYGLFSIMVPKLGRIGSTSM